MSKNSSAWQKVPGNSFLRKYKGFELSIFTKQEGGFRWYVDTHSYENLARGDAISEGVAKEISTLTAAQYKKILDKVKIV
jgi:hypothetical protein